MLSPVKTNARGGPAQREEKGMTPSSPSRWEPTHSYPLPPPAGSEGRRCLSLTGSRQLAPWFPHFSPQLQNAQEQAKGLGQWCPTRMPRYQLCLFSPESSVQAALASTQLAAHPRERQSGAAGDMPLPIKINGTKAPCVVHDVHLPGSFHFAKAPLRALLSPGCLRHRSKAHH